MGKSVLLSEIGSLKGPWSAVPLFLFTCESLAVIFYLEYVETKEITVKQLKIIKPQSQEHNLQ